MKMLWLSFLLVGSITCGPVRQDGVDPAFMQQPSSGYWYRGTGMSSGPGSSPPLPGLTNPSFAEATELPAQDVYYAPRSYSYSSYKSPEVGPYGVASAASPYGVASAASPYVAAPAGSYGGSAGVYGGDASYGFPPAPQDQVWSSGSDDDDDDDDDEILEPVYSDVSDLEPVSSFSSRSNYQRGRAVFSRTRYTPGAPVPLPGQPKQYFKY